MNSLIGKLVVAPDNSTPGSEGRLYLQLPEELAFYIGQKFRVLGNFHRDGAGLFILSGEGLSVTPKRQIWWKNGVRDHGIRENWRLSIYSLEQSVFVVILSGRTGETPPELPLRQDTLF